MGAFSSGVPGFLMGRRASSTVRLGHPHVDVSAGENLAPILFPSLWDKRDLENLMRLRDVSSSHQSIFLYFSEQAGCP